MRDPPDSLVVAEVHVCRGELLSVRPAEAGLVQGRIRVPSLDDHPAPAGRMATESFAQRFVTLLFRALAAWPV